MEIKPFQGWRYATPDGDVSSLICPPYDVLSQADKDALLRRDGRNIVAVDLPHWPPGEPAPDTDYRQAAQTLRRWQQTRLLRPDDAPGLYAYQQRYTWAGREYTRRALLAAVRLAPFGEGVWPHEKTFAGPRADRLKLARATGMQLSPIFGFYEDDAGATEALFAAAGEQPAAAGVLRGVEEKLWAVSDQPAVRHVARALAAKDLFIADGHHRYTTALEYRAGLGQVGEDHPANYVMSVLVAMNDPGLIVLPAHRVIGGLKDFRLERFAAATAEVMDYRPVRLGGDDVADADGFLRGFGTRAMAFAAGEEAVIGRLRDESVMDRVAADRVPAWRRLDVAVLHRLLIDRYLAESKTERMRIDYVADGRAALAAARAGEADLVVFHQATPLGAVRELALAGEVMPHKSTYFYPKVATGMVLYPLE